MGKSPSVAPPFPHHVPDDGELFARGDLLKNLKRELKTATAPMREGPPGESEHVARPAVFLPIEGESFGRGDVAGDGKNKGERPVNMRPIAVKFRADLPERRGLAVRGEFTDADIVGDTVHGDTSLNI